MFRLVASILGPFADLDAEEVTQEVFLRAHERIDGFRGEARFSTWLYRLAYNKTIERRRRARLRAEHVPCDEVGPTTPAGPLEAAVERERERAVARLVEDLPEVYRTVVHMRYWLDQSVGEIAEALGVPAGTVKSYLARARQRLRERATACGIVTGWDSPPHEARLLQPKCHKLWCGTGRPSPTNASFEPRSGSSHSRRTQG